MTGEFRRGSIPPAPRKVPSTRGNAGSGSDVSPAPAAARRRWLSTLDDLHSWPRTARPRRAAALRRRVTRRGRRCLRWRRPRRIAHLGDDHAPRSRQAGVRGTAVACRAARPRVGCRSGAPAGGAAIEPVRRRRLVDLRRRLLRPVRRNRSRGRQPRRRGPCRRRGVGRAVRPGVLRGDLHTGPHDRPDPPRRAHAARGPVPARRRCHHRGDDRPVPMQAPSRRGEGARPVTARLHGGAGAPRDPARDRAETRHRHRPSRRPRRVCRVLRVRRRRW